MTFIDLNAELNLWGENGELQLDSDKKAARAYFIEHVNKKTRFFHNHKEKAEYLVNEVELWDGSVVYRYGEEFFVKLMNLAYSFKFRFQTFMGAYKFYNQYALKSPNGDEFLERYEDRVVLNALQYSKNKDHAAEVVEEIISGRFQPATPTFLNAGRSFGGEAVSCFLLRLEDNMESISRAITDSLQLSKRGGGVSLQLSNIREAMAPIQGMEGQASGVVPVMKILEDSFSYANQLGARQGAGAVYLNAHHPDILSFLDTKRENADEKIRIKTLSLGVVVPDITFELAKNNSDMYLFSPYDVERVYGIPFSDISVTKEYYNMLENPEIRKKKINAREFFKTLAQIQTESGYPYLVFDDTVNAWNPVPNVGRISFSNLCSEIMQPQIPSQFNKDGSFYSVGRDISCNLASLNIAKMAKLRPADFKESIRVAYWFLDEVTDQSNLSCSPSIAKGNADARAIGLGQMNLHGYFIEKGIDYDSEEARQWFKSYIADVTYYMIRYSSENVKDVGSFNGFAGSAWEDGSHIQKIINDNPTSRVGVTIEDWEDLQKQVTLNGLANQNLQAIPPTGSISYINNSTSSIHPVTSKVEIRKEGKVGRVYYPAYGMTNDNHDSILNAYEYGAKAVIDMYSVAVPYVDQGMSLTLFFPDTATTRDINKAQIYAWQKGVKSIYYIRLSQKAIAGTEVEECVSCML